MESKWLEDFLALADTGSFSRAATLRHVTQPAFSRRIQSLEAWLGVELVDRRALPTGLTPAGIVFYGQATEMLAHLRCTRALLLGQRRQEREVLDIAVPPSLIQHFLPAWLARLRAAAVETAGEFCVQLMARGVHEATQLLQDGACDLMLGYHHPAHPHGPDAAQLDSLVLATDILRPYARNARDAVPRPLPGTRDDPLPYLAYAPGSFLGRVVEGILAQGHQRPFFRECCVAESAASLKMLALEGYGLAFLPSASVLREARQRRLAPVDGGQGEWQARLEIRVSRYRAATRRPGKELVNRLWQILQEQSVPAGENASGLWHIS